MKRISIEMLKTNSNAFDVGFFRRGRQVTAITSVIVDHCQPLSSMWNISVMSDPKWRRVQGSEKLIEGLISLGVEKCIYRVLTKHNMCAKKWLTLTLILMIVISLVSLWNSALFLFSHFLHFFLSGTPLDEIKPWSGLLRCFLRVDQLIHSQELLPRVTKSRLVPRNYCGRGSVPGLCFSGGPITFETILKISQISHFTGSVNKLFTPCCSYYEDNVFDF